MVAPPICSEEKRGYGGGDPITGVLFVGLFVLDGPGSLCSLSRSGWLKGAKVLRLDG
jgi:hypothetical protein